MPDVLDKALYGEYNAKGRIFREPQRCIISGALIDSNTPRWRVKGTSFFVRYTSTLRGVTQDMLIEATRSLTANAAIEPVVSSEDEPSQDELSHDEES
jgi:hypothetical protein